jgi:nitrogenase subunit NifH
LEIDIAITGHNGIVEGRKQVKERLNKYKSVIDKREEKILQSIPEKKTITLNELTHKNIIYRSYNDIFSEYLHVAEKIMLQKHFDKFLKNGVVEKAEKGYILC